MNYGVQAIKKAENYGNYRSWNTIGVFGAETKVVVDEESGVCSPPLWKNSPSRSPQHRGNHYRSLSPTSRAQAIARGQRELMEMVSRMPEGCYELSLKDLVEQPMVEVKQESRERSIRNEEEMHRREKGKKMMGRKLQKNASGSIDNGGFLLKMVFPISWGSRTKKKNNNYAMSNSLKDGRASPKPLLSDGSAKSVDKEWWKKRFSEEGDSESGGLSSNSGSSKSSGSGSSSSRSSSRNSSRYICMKIFRNCEQ